MSKIAVVKAGGKQYLAKEGTQLTVDLLPNKEKETVELETLAIFDEEGKEVKLGQPNLKKTVTAEIVKHLKGDKIRVGRN